MSKRKIFIVFAVIVTICSCIFNFAGCTQKEQPKITDAVMDDNISERISFGKKYYYLGYDNYSKNEYYTINDDGSASYTHIIKEGNTTTFHQIIHFKWTYAGEGNCILLHNGTQIVKGTQDDAFGIGRVMNLAKDVIYWSASGENTYYICEDFLSLIPNYAKLI